jgi:septal ring factor EnvC (AmiA/AmiB activator)
MKRISFMLAALMACAAPAVRAQDAATEERLNKLSGEIENLAASQEVLKKQIANLAKDLESLREQSSKPSPNYARPEDLNNLAEKIKEVDRKRLEDAEKVRTELLKLRRVLEAPLATPKKPSSSVKSPKDSATTAPAAGSDKGFEYVVQSGDTLDAIALAYREKNIKVTVAQILAANPGLKPERMQVGKTIFIPAPQP